MEDLVLGDLVYEIEREITELKETARHYRVGWRGCADTAESSRAKGTALAFEIGADRLAAIIAKYEGGDAMSRDGTLPPGVDHWDIEEAQEPTEHERWKALTNEEKVAEEIEEMRHYLTVSGHLSSHAEDGARIIVALQHLEAFERRSLIDSFDEAAVAAAHERNKRARTPVSEREPEL